MRLSEKKQSSKPLKARTRNSEEHCRVPECTQCKFQSRYRWRLSTFTVEFRNRLLDSRMTYTSRAMLDENVPTKTSASDSIRNSACKPTYSSYVCHGEHSKRDNG